MKTRALPATKRGFFLLTAFIVIVLTACLTSLGTFRAFADSKPTGTDNGSADTSSVLTNVDIGPTDADAGSTGASLGGPPLMAGTVDLSTQESSASGGILPTGHTEDWYDCNWMSTLPDEAKLNELSIPGAHDATTAKISLPTFAQTQTYYVEGLLYSGVRYFDLRIKDDDDTLKMCHGSQGCKDPDGDDLTLETVIEEWMLPFLSDYPSETIIIQIKAGNDDDADANENSYRYFSNLALTRPDKVYIGDHVPTLGEARGKLVILSRLDLDDVSGVSDYSGRSNNEYWALDISDFPGGHNYSTKLGASGDNYEVWVEDQFDVSPNEKWDWVKGSLTGDRSAAVRKNNARNNGKDAWVIVYSSLSYQNWGKAVAKIIASGLTMGLFVVFDDLFGDGDFGITWPKDGAEEVNPKLESLLRSNRTLFTGCLEMDFVTPTLSRLVYSTNFSREGEDPWNSEHMVTFDPGNGMLAPGATPTQDVYFGKLAKRPPDPIPSEAGSAFLGWFTEDGKRWYFDRDTVKSNVKLYAEYASAAMEYVDAAGNSMGSHTVKLLTEDKQAEVSYLSALVQDAEHAGGWYAVSGDLDISAQGNVVVQGDVNLILCDGATLTVNNRIEVPEGSSLTIWAQSTDGDMGKIVSSDGMGVNTGARLGDITINGGNVQVVCLGGGTGGTVTINGGEVKADASGAVGMPGIGGTLSYPYEDRSDMNVVTITGGTVRASGGQGAAGIGGGNGYDGGPYSATVPITITGGSVVAQGGNNAAGIGGNMFGTANVTILGGEVEATGGSGYPAGEVAGGSGIGNGSPTVAQGGSVNISGGTVTANGGTDAAGIGGKGASVNLEWTNEDDSISASSYDGTVSVSGGKTFMDKDDQTPVTADDIAKSTGRTIVPVLPHTHSLEAIARVEPTCTTAGTEAYWRCTVCGKLFSDSAGANEIDSPISIEPTGHAWGAVEYSWATTAGNDGAERILCVAVRTCQADEEHFEFEIAAATTETVSEPTCNVPGTLRDTATFEADWAQTQTRERAIPATGQHTEGTPKTENAVDPTCTEPGSYEEVIYCTECGEELSRELKVGHAALGHDWGEWIVDQEATEQANGKRHRVCARCNEVEEQIIPAKEHVHVWIPAEGTAATCTHHGIKDHYVCEGCGTWGAEDKYSPETILEVTDRTSLWTSAVGHTALKDITPSKEIIRKATCTEPGSNREIYKCEKCGKTLMTKQVTVSATGHDWAEPTYTWSADNTIVTARRVCNHDSSHVEEVATMTDAVVSKEATCIEKGDVTYTATFKNKAFTQQEKTVEEINALGHDWSEWTQIKAPTCTEAGEEQRICSHDATHREARELAATGHAWGDWTVTKEPTETEEGVETRTCANDPTHVETRSVPKLDPQVISYRATAGDGATWTKGSGETLSFTFKRSSNDSETFGHFTGIDVDGKAVDAADYTAKPGSVVVSLNPSYLETLAVGEHAIAAHFSDGNAASAAFTVTVASDGGIKQDSDNGASDNGKRNGASAVNDDGNANRSGKASAATPFTGDAAGVLPCALMLATLLAALTAALAFRKYRER